MIFEFWDQFCFQGVMDNISTSQSVGVTLTIASLLCFTGANVRKC